jgi:hypothetical protein
MLISATLGDQNLTILTTNYCGGYMNTFHARYSSCAA